MMTKFRNKVERVLKTDESAGSRETREVMRNRALMKEIRQGLQQLETGQRFTFEEVFGEPLQRRKRAKKSRGAGS